MKNKVIFYIILNLLIYFSLHPKAVEKKLIAKDKYLKAYLIYLKAERLEKKNNIGAAIKKYKDAIKKYNEFPEVYYKLGIIYYSKKKYKQSFQYFNLANSFKTNFRNQIYKIKNLEYLAILSEKMDKLKLALKYYLLLVLHNQSKYVNKMKYYYKVGELYYKLKEYKNAEDYLIKFLSFKNLNVSDKISSLKLLVNIAMEKDDCEKALKYLYDIYSIKPNKEIKYKIKIMENNCQYYRKNK